jgi:3-oxoacyl-[acyl-carrier-protein] synthase II
MRYLDHRGRPRVVVTGIGLKSPAGLDLETFWDNVLSARPQAAPIQRFDASEFPVTFACEVKDFDPLVYADAKEARRLDRVTQFALGAAVDALADAGDLNADPARCAVVAGTGIGGLISFEEQHINYMERGYRAVSPFTVPMFMPNAPTAVIGMEFGWTGPNFCVATACATSANAIGEGVRMIRDGSADVVMAGGAEAVITKMTISAFWRMTTLSTRNDAPELASRPFDVDRDGFVMGEGAAFLVLEQMDRAVERGARIHGELLGYGRNNDAYHITAPSPGGAGAAACMEHALADAGLAPAAIGHVNAHGTSTPLNDAAEAEAVRKVFGDTPPPITSTKGVLGHMIGAAGAVEAIAALRAVCTGLVPPTANHKKIDPDMPVDVVAGSPRDIGVAPAVSNSFGFGGHNATLVLGPPPADV